MTYSQLVRLVSLIFLMFHAAASFVPTAKSKFSLPPGTECLIMFAKKKIKNVQEIKANHDKWQPYFERLVQYYECHGSYDVDDDEELSLWLEDQRKQHQGLQEGKKVKLTRKRAVALERIGVISDDQF